MTEPGRRLLSESVKFIKSVGPKRAESFARIGINSIRDLLYYFPSKYLDRSTIVNISKAYAYLVNGYNGEFTVIGRVTDKERVRYGKKEMLKVHLKDESGFFECIWFQGARFLHDLFREGEYYAISAKPSLSKYGNIQFVHPDFDRITEDESQEFLNTGKIIPFYRLPKELRATNIGDLGIRRIIHYAVEKYVDEVSETLPFRIIDENKLLPLVQTIKNLHFPESKEKLQEAQIRIKFEELLFIEILVALRRSRIKLSPGIPMKVRSHLISDFLKSLPFQLTQSQLNVLSEIRKDMESNKPMNRLLQGDVGSGKTIVALIAMLIAKDNGYQSVIMAPTEILAAQHFKNVSMLLKEFNIKISLLTGALKGKERKLILESAADQSIDIMIGTHALFEEDVQFRNLGLAVIDEQHRFGVVQRSKLFSKGYSPDILVMSATPIPRTLSMTIYGDLDISVIHELPGSRKKIKTYLRGESRLPMIYKFILDKSRQGYQTFIIYPLVKESEKLDLKAAITHYEELRTIYLGSLRVGLVHGQLSWSEKDTAMKRFREKEFDVLVSTTVIEVGIDIPDANIIIINDAHRFGLSQLHQLRGRVGRSSSQAYCILVTRDEYANKSEGLQLDLEYMSESGIEKNKTMLRLQSMTRYSSGFDISEIDLKLRGPGDIFGIKQSGFPELKYADLINDSGLLTKAKQLAFDLVGHDPELKSPDNRILRDTLLSNYKDHLDYSKIA